MTITNPPTATADRARRSREDGYRLADYIGFVHTEGERFAAIAESTPLEADITACPGWSMRHLIRHLGEIHLWAAANVAAPRDGWLHVAELGDLRPYWPELATHAQRDDELVSWYRATHRNLIDVLESAPLDVPALRFLPAPSPLIMWARRQASEIAVHRFDAEQAGGATSQYDPAFAADMLDELLLGFAPLTKHLDLEEERVLLVHAVDVNVRRWLTIGPNGIRTARRGDHADLTLAATAAHLYLLLWNRDPGGTVQMDGDASVLSLWRRSCRVEWLR